jgi:hypothetical protein
LPIALRLSDPQDRLARLKGFEPLTHCLEGSCSIQLSYRRSITLYNILKRNFLQSGNYKNLYDFVSRNVDWAAHFLLYYRIADASRTYGRLAQLGEHHVRNVGVGGSNPLPSTNPSRVGAVQ